MKPNFKTSKGSVSFTTPLVVAQYPMLVKPDTKFDAVGVYKVNFTVQDDAYWQAVIEKANEMIKEYAAECAKKANKKMKLSPDLPWTENEDGTITFKAKIKAQYSTYAPEVHQFDAKGKPIKPKVEIKGGSEVKLNLELRPWETSGKVGISLRPLAAQVITMGTGGGDRSAGGFGFGEEDGYEFDADEAQSTPFTDDTDMGEEGDDPIDF